VCVSVIVSVSVRKRDSGREGLREGESERELE
jgi:hypothetical protein